MASIHPAIPGHDYFLPSHVLTFVYDELHNISSTPCVNVTILDDIIPESERYITIDLMTPPNDVRIVPGKNQTIIAILDDDHGMLGNFFTLHFEYITCRDLIKRHVPHCSLYKY